MILSEPGTILSVLELITFGVLGVFALISIFDRVMKGRMKESDEIDDRLIKNLKTSVDLLTSDYRKPKTGSCKWNETWQTLRQQMKL